MSRPGPSLRRRLALALTGVAMVAALVQPGPAAADTSLDAADLAYALDLETRIADNLRYDQLFELDYATDERVPGQVASYHHFGDSALWTGTYLAAQSFRYAIAKHHIAAGSDVAFWAGQKDEAKARIDRMVKQYHLLINISKNWDYEFQPSLDPPGFGGGVFRGEPGYLFRACIPTDAPASHTWGVPRGPRVFGPLDWDDGKQYYCEDGTSRDMYAGTTFGLLTAFDLVSTDDPAMRATIRDDILTMTLFTAKYGWTTPRPHGNISLPPGELEEISPVDIWGHDFENFISPLFTYVPLARLNMAMAARHVARSALPKGKGRVYSALWAEEVATQLPLLAASMEIDAFQPNESYYKFNLHHLTGFNLVRLETDPALRLAFKQALGVMDATTGDDLNAHFETITYAMTGERRRIQAAIEHLRQWKEYRARMNAGLPTRNSDRCGVDVRCVRRDRLDAVVAGREVTVFQGVGTSWRAAVPLPVADRAPTDFLWQRPPTQLDGQEYVRYQPPGVDYLLPYWMIRYYTEVAKPALDPFPPWPGPAHR